MFAFWKPPDKQNPRTNIGGEELPFRVQSDPIVGYRLWRVKATPDGFGLFSLNMPYQWEIENQADCMKRFAHHMTPGITVGHDGPAPSLSCQCGLYIMLEDTPLNEWDHTVKGRVHGYGTVELSGRVIKCAMGYKAERAEIVSVMVDAACDQKPGVCEENVAYIDPQLRAYCEDHASGGFDLLDASEAMERIRSQLEMRYPGVEVMSWLI